MTALLKGKGLAQARREIAALQPGEIWMTDHPISIEEYNLLTPENTFAELYDGVIYMPAPSLQHEAAYAFVFTLLHVYADAQSLGVVLGSRTPVRLSDFSAPQPDVVFVQKRRRHIVQGNLIKEPPDLIMEFISSDSSRYRALSKMLRYEELEVPEFWFIDLERKYARLCHLTRQGRYESTFEGKRGVISSKVVTGFAMQCRWLWSEPGSFPSTFSIVQELVAGRVPR